MRCAVPRLSSPLPPARPAQLTHHTLLAQVAVERLILLHGEQDGAAVGGGPLALPVVHGVVVVTHVAVPAVSLLGSSWVSVLEAVNQGRSMSRALVVVLWAGLKPVAPLPPLDGLEMRRRTCSPPAAGNARARVAQAAPCPGAG